jgi:signal transduction histidine kinase
MYLDEVIDEVVRAGRVVASTKNVRIELDTMPATAWAGDEDLIRRLVGNLLDNAIRHSPRGSAVTLRLEPTAAGFTIAVSDAGSGIPPEMQPHIFERFYRVDRSRSRSRKDGGAGLGLALARWIAHVHGGEVSLTKSSDAGSTFTIFLPRLS